MAILAGLLCADRSTPMGLIAGLKGKDGKVLSVSDFDAYNRSDKPEPKELTADDFMRVLSRKSK